MDAEDNKNIKQTNGDGINQENGDDTLIDIEKLRRKENSKLID